MEFSMKFMPSVLMMVAVLFYSSSGVDAGMTCAEVLGMPISCPLPFQDDAKAFCCYSEDNIPHCCNFPDYVMNNTAIIAGVIIAIIILLLLCTLCCCCCCSCCLLAKRRQQRGTLYGPVMAAPVYLHGNPNYPLQPTVHSPPPAYPQDVNPAYNPGYMQQR